MQPIKIASLWNAKIDLKNLVIINLIKNLSKRNIEFVKIKDCDILFFGPFENQSFLQSIQRRVLNKFLRTNNKIKNLFPNLDIYLLNRKIKPLRIFFSGENYEFPNVKFDFSISSHLGINRKNHLRYPVWKEYIDWSEEGIIRELDIFAARFDKYYDKNKMLVPQGNSFLKKPREICIISSHLREPRESLISIFSKNFKVDGYGPIFNQKIKDHHSNPIKKIDILSKYAFNLCPENSLYPGYYTEKVTESFLGKSLPITWADSNIDCDFNKNSFINLLEFSKNNYEEICDKLKDDNYLKKFTHEPLLLKKPDLELEIKFVKKILSAL
jgi:hypothetical protein